MLAALRPEGGESIQGRDVPQLHKLHETQIYGPGREIINIERDWEYQKLREFVKPKLKEFILSDQAYAVAEINRIVWEALKPNLIARDVVTVWHTDRPTYRFIRAILAPRAFRVGEASEIPSAGEKYDNLDVTVYKIGLRPFVSREMIEDAVWDVVARQLAEGGRAMAQKENEDILALLNTQAAVGNNYQGYGATAAAASPGNLQYSDIVGAIAGVRGQNAFPDTLIVQPSEEGDLLKDEKFIHTFYFGGLMRKALGPQEYFQQMLGFRTLTTTLQTSGKALMLDSTRHAGMVIRRDVTVENVVDPIKDLAGASLTERFNIGVLRHLASFCVTDA